MFKCITLNTRPKFRLLVYCYSKGENTYPSKKNVTKAKSKCRCIGDLLMEPDLIWPALSSPLSLPHGNQKAGQEGEVARGYNNNTAASGKLLYVPRFLKLRNKCNI